MEIIIDNNVLFSLMNPTSTASKIQKEVIKIYAPNFIKSELEEHEEECISKSGLKREDFHKRKIEVFSEIEFIDVENYKHFLKKALKLIKDEDDVPYLALGLSLNVPIWSNDPDLRAQNAVPIFTTRELIEAVF